MTCHQGLTTAAAALFTLACAQPLCAQGDGQLVEQGGGSLVRTPVHAHQHCISPAQREAVEARIAAFYAAHAPLAPLNDEPGSSGGGPTGGGGGLPAPVRYAFWPQGGTLGRDLATNNFVDLIPGTGIGDFACSNWTYDGHRGHDIDIRAFGDQDIGVPIFAAADGTVIDTDDGHFDRNTSWSGQPANYVVIDHGNGRLTLYWHMRSGSVAVSPGQVVVAGQQIGMTGSSGISTSPHLHFESRQNSAIYEPFAGNCRTGSSGWVDQPAINRTPVIRDFGMHATTLSQVPGPPFDLPRTLHAAFTDGTLYYWMQGYNMPAGATVQWKFYRPSGALEFASTPTTPGWATTQGFRSWWAWYGWNLTAMRSVAGLWRVEVLINGVVRFDGPIDVRPTRSPANNTAPNPVTLAFDPPQPVPGQVNFCRVTSSLAADDTNYDLVRHRFVWRVGATVVRDVTVACLSDTLPRNAWTSAAAPLSVTVTPLDATLAGTSTTISFGCGPSDIASAGQTIGADSQLSADDIIVFIGWFFGADARADVAGSGQTAGADGLFTADDIILFINRFFAGC